MPDEPERPLQGHSTLELIDHHDDEGALTELRTRLREQNRKALERLPSTELFLRIESDPDAYEELRRRLARG